MSRYLTIEIPLPPKEIQNQIIENSDKIDKEYNSSLKRIKDYRKQVSEIFQSLDTLRGETYKLSSADFKIMIGKRVLNRELKQTGIPVYSANVYEPLGLIDKDIVKDFNQPSILWGIDGDWMVNTIQANEPFYPTDHAGVLRVNNDKINYRYLAHRLEQEGLREGFSRSYRASIKQIEKLSLVIPPIEKQNYAVKRIEEIESKIYDEQQRMGEIQKEKSSILDRFFELE